MDRATAVADHCRLGKEFELGIGDCQRAAPARQRQMSMKDTKKSADYCPFEITLYLQQRARYHMLPADSPLRKLHPA
jgi:hypothetical protein